MTTPLFPYQIEGAAFLAQKGRALLADGMRVGKTGAVIGASDLVGAEDVLELTTGSARADHARAWKRFQTMPRRVTPLFSSSDSVPTTGSIITSYDLAAGPLRKKLQARKFDAVIPDESHRLKTRTAQRTKFVYGEHCDGDGIIRDVTNVWPLSGTPAPNNYAELWPMCRAVLPHAIEQNGKPMSYWAFVNRYCKTQDNGFGVKIVGNKNAAELKARLAPYFLRRTLSDIGGPSLRFDVLPLTSSERLTELKEMERSQIIQDIQEQLDRARDEDARAALLAKVDQQVQMRLRRLTGLAKVKPVAEWVKDQISDGLEKIVIFAWHRDVIDGLVQEIGPEKCLRLYGGVAPEKKQPLVDDFHRDRRKFVFVGQIEAAGEAIDLSVANEALLVEWAWTPGPNDQAACRILNVVKGVPGLCRFAFLVGSLDERVAQICAWKAADIRKIFE